MSLSPQWLDELRTRITLSAVIGRSTRLTRAGREFKACCPFHNEKSPSFTVNDEKGFYHCFGCGAHGDAIRWMTDQRGLEFMDAVKELAAEAGMEVPAPDPQAANRSRQRASLHDAMAAAQDWFVANLHSPAGAAAMAYLEQRGFNAHTIARFGFGFAPDDRQALKRALDGFPEAMLIEAGLRIAVDGREPYDRFRGRLMLPIQDARGRVIAFGGRILDAGKTDSPKYLNSPDTPLFDKGRTLYNLHRAAPAARTQGRLIVVEGYMDVIALAAAGIEECVAPMGTALTETQIELLWRQVDTPILCFDGDAAGQRAAMRAVTRALPMLKPAHSLKIVQLPAKMDPDDIINKFGVQSMELLLDESYSIFETLWMNERHADAIDGPEAKAGLRSKLLAHIDTIVDPIIRSLYRQDLFEKFSKYVYGKRDKQKEPEEEDNENRARWRWLANLSIDEFQRYLHRRLGAAIARGFMIWPTELPNYVESLVSVPDLEPRIDAMIDALSDFHSPDVASFRLAIEARALSEPVPEEFSRVRFPFAWPYWEKDRAISSLADAVAMYSEVPKVKQQLEIAQARYERDVDEESERERNRLQAVLQKKLSRFRAIDRHFNTVPAEREFA